MWEQNRTINTITLELPNLCFINKHKCFFLTKDMSRSIMQSCNIFGREDHACMA